MKTISQKRKPESSENKSNVPFFNKDSDMDGKSTEPIFFNKTKSASTPFFTVQPKLTFGKPNDVYEQEAESMADQLLAKSTETPAAQTPEIQSKCDDCEEEELQMKGNDEASSGFESQLKSTTDAGSPLPKNVQREMEAGFGADFSKVNIHKGASAEKLSSAINAQAFTQGKDIYFNKGKYQPDTKAGKHLLAHELTHVLQQQSSLQKAPELISRACEAGTTKSWADKVSEMQKLTGDEKNTCTVSLLKEALGSGTVVHQSTNTEADLDKAVTAGHYKARGTDKAINFDVNFNTKTGNPNQFGEAKYVTKDGVTTVYIIMGPNAINSFGPDFTKMAHQHEQDHADDYTAQAASGTLHSATEGEELRIYTRGFTGFFLSLFSLDTSACTFEMADDFSMVFNSYKGAKKDEQDAAYSAIEGFYNNTIKGDANNKMKFKIWFQSMVNSRDATDALVIKINALEGLSLKKGAKPTDHLVCSE